MFIYIHFSVPPARITDLVRNVSDGWKIYWYGTVSHLCLCFCFFQLGLCSVSYTANEYSIYHFCIMIKDFHFFSRVIVVQDFETVTVLCVICIQADLLCYFCWIKRLAVSSQFNNSLFILYISTAKPFSLLVRGYIEVKINNTKSGKLSPS